MCVYEYVSPEEKVQTQYTHVYYIHILYTQYLYENAYIVYTYIHIIQIYTHAQNWIEQEYK